MKTYNYGKDGGSQKVADGITRLGSPTELEKAIKTKEEAVKWFAAQTKGRFAALQVTIANVDIARNEGANTDAILHLQRQMANEDRLFQYFKLATESLEKDVGNGAH